MCVGRVPLPRLPPMRPSSPRARRRFGLPRHAPLDDGAHERPMIPVLSRVNEESARPGDGGRIRKPLCRSGTSGAGPEPVTRARVPVYRVTSAAGREVPSIRHAAAPRKGWPMRILVIEDDRKVAQLHPDRPRAGGPRRRPARTTARAPAIRPPPSTTTPSCSTSCCPGGPGSRFSATSAPESLAARAHPHREGLAGGTRRRARRGADDYMTKPFALAELSARLRALLRRGAPRESVLRVADLEMDTIRRQVRRAGPPIDLKPKEYALLEFLMRHSRPSGHQDRSSSSTSGTSTSTASATSSRCTSTRCATRSTAGFDLPLIHTIRGVGYILTDKPS